MYQILAALAEKQPHKHSRYHVGAGPGLSCRYLNTVDTAVETTLIDQRLRPSTEIDTIIWSKGLFLFGRSKQIFASIRRDTIDTRSETTLIYPTLKPYRSVFRPSIRIDTKDQKPRPYRIVSLLSIRRDDSIGIGVDFRG